MQKNSRLVAGLTLAAVAVAGLSTAAMADRNPGPRGAHGGPGFDLTRIFAELDADKDGKITKAEVEAWQAAQPKVEDTDGDGKISAAELAAPRIAEATRRADAQAARMVERLDTDGDGLLSAAELAAGGDFGPRGQRGGPRGPGMGGEGPDFGMIFDRIDADKDGAVTLEEIEQVRDSMRQRMEDRGPGKHGEREGRGDRGPGKRPPMMLEGEGEVPPAPEN